MDEWVKRSPGTSKSLGTHCCTHLSEQSHVNGIIENEGSNRSRECGPIENTKVLFGG